MRLWKAYAGLVLVAVFWGASFVATKTVLNDLSPATITVSRFGLGLLVIILLLGPERARRALVRRRFAPAAVLGFLGITLHQWLQANGLKTAQATAGSWIVATIPIFVAVVSRIVLGERLGLMRSIGVVTASIGALVVIGRGNLLSVFDGHAGTVGDLLFLISAFNWAIFTVISRGVLARPIHLSTDGIVSTNSEKQMVAEDPLSLMFVVMLVGWFFSLIWLAADGGWRDLFVMQLESTLSILFLGIASSGLAYAFWYGSLQLVPAAQAGAFLYIEPFVTALLAWPILGERMSAGTFLGGAAIILGVWLVNRGK